MFGNIGLPEMMVIMAIALLVFGPKKLPEVGRTIGKAIREFKKSTDEIKDKFEEQIRVEEFKSIQDDIKKSTDEIKDKFAEQIPVEEFKSISNDIKKGINEDGENKKIS